MASPRWLLMVAALLIPGSGHVLLGRPMRGLLLLFWMCILAFVTFRLSNETISIVGRFSGGIAVWVLSVLEVSRLRKK